MFACVWYSCVVFARVYVHGVDAVRCADLFFWSAKCALFVRVYVHGFDGVGFADLIFGVRVCLFIVLMVLASQI